MSIYFNLEKKLKSLSHEKNVTNTISFFTPTQPPPSLSLLRMMTSFWFLTPMRNQATNEAYWLYLWNYYPELDLFLPLPLPPSMSEPLACHLLFPVATQYILHLAARCSSTDSTHSSACPKLRGLPSYSEENPAPPCACKTLTFPPASTSLTSPPPSLPLPILFQLCWPPCCSSSMAHLIQPRAFVLAALFAWNVLLLSYPHGSLLPYPLGLLYFPP